MRADGKVAGTLRRAVRPEKTSCGYQPSITPEKATAVRRAASFRLKWQVEAAIDRFVRSCLSETAFPVPVGVVAMDTITAITVGQVEVAVWMEGKVGGHESIAAPEIILSRHDLFVSSVSTSLGANEVSPYRDLPVPLRIN